MNTGKFRQYYPMCNVNGGVVPATACATFVCRLYEDNIEVIDEFKKLQQIVSRAQICALLKGAIGKQC